MSQEKSQAKRKAQDLELPERGQDAAERKRVLNILAQRRYRERKREHVQKLEAKAQASSAEPEGGTSKSKSSSPESRNSLSLGASHCEEREADPHIISEEPTVTKEVFDETSFGSTSCFQPTAFEAGPTYPADETNPGQSNFPRIDPFANYDSNMLAFPMDNQCFWDTSVLLPSLPSTPLSSATNASSNESAPWSLTSLPSADDTTQHGGSASKKHSPSTLPSPSDLPRQDMQYSFPDEAHLEMIELTLLRGCMTIARRLNVQDLMWSLSALSPFADPSMALAQYNHLPTNLQPTMVQRTIPHHPLIDLLPWPAVRDKLIVVLSQPPEVRPPQAASPMALLEFVYDIEDSAEGVRISGNDPYSGNNWEVGEKVFKSWWWIFDREVIRRSNELRKLRGAPMLGTSTGTVLGEVA